MNFIFFENPTNPDKLAYTVSSDTTEALKKRGVIPSKAKTLEIPYVEPKDMDSEFFLMLYNLESVKFDSKTKPTKLVVNSDVAIMEHLAFIRKQRDLALVKLDSLQIRHMVKGNTKVTEAIEKDKQKLRDLPITFKPGRVNSLAKLHNQIPVEILVDYEEKYKGV